MTNTTPEEPTETTKEVMNEVNSKKRPMSDDNDAGKLAARREANRIHALKSRQRSKALLQELQRTVTQLSGDKAELERENAVMRAQIDVLQQQNIALTQSQRMLLMRAGQLGGAAPGSGMNAFAPGLFGLSQAASMPSAAPGTTANNAGTNAASTTSIANAAPAPGATAPNTSASNGGEAGSLDQAAVAAAAAAMIQGQAAAAAAAAAGFQPQFQQFMGGMQAMAGAAPAPPASAPAPTTTSPAPFAPAVTATTAPTAAPTPNAALTPPPPSQPVQAPATSAPPITAEPVVQIVKGDEVQQALVVLQDDM